VGLPLHNERRYIEETLRSLAAQDFHDFKVLISDNASDDGSEELCRSFANADNRFIYVRHPENIGAARNFTFCLDASSSEYFMWCGAHDVVSRNFLSCLTETLDRAPEVSLAFGTRLAVDENSAPIEALNDDRYIYHFSRNRYLRYLQCACVLSECTIVYGLFRRKYLNGFAIKPVQACDNVLLSHLLFFGKLKYNFSAAYTHRFFSARTTTAAERILGTKSKIGMDEKSLVDYFGSDINACAPNRRSFVDRWRKMAVIKVIKIRYLSRAGRYVRFVMRLRVRPARTLRSLLRPSLRMLD
jgi:glycosyltransferase involved in cell wall biosynthesis